MVKTNAVERRILTGITQFGSISDIRKQASSFRSLAHEFSTLSRPAIVRVGIESLKHDTKTSSFSPSERLASLISYSPKLSIEAPSTTAWAWDQIGRDPKTDQRDFTRALSIFQTERKTWILDNLSRIHDLWRTVVRNDNLSREIESLLAGVPEGTNGSASNHIFWAGHAITQGSYGPLGLEVFNLAKFLGDCTRRFDNGYGTIGELCSMTETLGRKVETNANEVLRNESDTTKRIYALGVKDSVSHAADIAEAYLKMLPTEVLVYSSDGTNAEHNIPEAVSGLFREEDPEECMNKMMNRAFNRRTCPNGPETVGKWGRFFEEFMRRSALGETNGLTLKQFDSSPVVADYLGAIGQ